MTLGTVEGPTEGHRPALRIPKAGGLKSASQVNQSDLESSWFSS